MAPFKALYGQKCRSPVRWDDNCARKLLGPDLITQTADKVTQIRKHLQASQDRQRSWANSKRRHLEFRVGDHVFLKISLTRTVIRFGSTGKLSSRYIEQFEVMERVGAVAYKLALPPSPEGVYDIFHVSQLRKYVPDEKHVLDCSELMLKPNLTYEIQPATTLDRREKVLKNKVISLVRSLGL